MKPNKRIIFANNTLYEITFDKTDIISKAEIKDIILTVSYKPATNEPHAKSDNQKQPS